MDEVRNLCDVFLQEHWLLPYELKMLNNIHSDFGAFSHSSVDISRDVLDGIFEFEHKL